MILEQKGFFSVILLGLFEGFFSVILLGFFEQCQRMAISDTFEAISEHIRVMSRMNEFDTSKMRTFDEIPNALSESSSIGNVYPAPSKAVSINDTIDERLENPIYYLSSDGPRMECKVQ